MIEAWSREILLLQVATAWFMTGLIWFVQLVHYPLMSRVDAGAWTAYEREHQRRTTWIVAPVMLTELITAGLLIAIVLDGSEAFISNWVSASIWIASAMLVVAWISTFAVQTRVHMRLSKSHDPALLQLLVTSNWVRTFAWTVRAALLTSLLG